MISEIEEYFAKGCGRCARFATPDCSTRKWAPGLARLRDLCREAGLEETVKWGHPCYAHAGRNIAIIGAFREDFRLSFFDAGLLNDPEGILEKQGPNTAHADALRFTDADMVVLRAATIRAFLAEAMGYAEAGIRPPPTTTDIVLPDDLAVALDDDPDLGAAFDRLTPGRRKSYVIALSSARRPDTRARRIEGFRDKILQGKGATER